MGTCVNCIDVTKLGTGKCNPISSDCVIYSGPNLPCSTIKTNETITLALQKIEAILCTAGSGINLNYVASPIDGLIENSGGTDAIIPLADSINAGLLSPGDFVAIQGLTGLITQTITDGDTTHAPSGDAVFDALALKANNNNVLHRTTAETFTGYKTALNSGSAPSGIIIVNNIDALNPGFQIQNDSAAIGADIFTNGDGDALWLRTMGAGTALTITSSNFGGKPFLYANLGIETTWIEKIGDIHAPKFIKVGGLISQYLMADGSVSTLANITSGLIAPTIVDGDLTHAPDGNSVFDALALKVSNIVAGSNITVNSVDPLNPIISAIPGTSAGVFDRVYFTGQVATVATPVGPNYDTLRNGKGSVASVAIASPSLAASSKVFFVRDMIGPAQLVNGTLPIGNYSSFLSVLPSSAIALKRFTIEIFLCDNTGVIIPQAGPPSTDPNAFYAGKNTVVILDSGDLTLPASNSSVGLTGYLSSVLNVTAGQRFRYHMSVARGATGGAQTMTLNVGNAWNSYVEAPVPITTSTVVNLSTVPGATATDALNALNASKVSGTGVAGQVSFWSGTNVQAGDNELFWNNTTKKFGLGTQTLIGKFNVFTGTSGFTNDINAMLDGSLYFSNDHPTFAAPVITGKSTTAVGLSLFAATNDISSTDDMRFDARRSNNQDFTSGNLTSSAFRWTRFNTTLFNILRNGNASLSTIKPVSKFDIQTGLTSINITGLASGNISFGNNGIVSHAPIMLGKTDANNTTGLLIIAATSDTNSNPDMALDVRKGDTNNNYTLPGTAFRFGRFGTSLVDILRNGNVGIGTTNPNYNLHINSATTGSFLQFTSIDTGTTSTDGFIIGTGTGGNAQIRNRENTSMSFFTNDIEKMTLLSNGNVGIGTIAPTTPLSIVSTNNVLIGCVNTVSTGQTIISMSNDLANATLVLGINNSAFPTVFDFGKAGDTFIRASANSKDLNIINTSTTDGSIRFLTSLAAANAAERMRILSNGNVGIGIANPSAKLTVLSSQVSIPALGSYGTNTSLALVGGGTGLYGLLSGVLGTGDVYQQVQRVDGTATAYNLLLQPNGGNVGIGTQTPTLGKLQIVGNQNTRLIHAESNLTPTAGVTMAQGIALTQVNIEGAVNAGYAFMTNAVNPTSSLGILSQVAASADTGTIPLNIIQGNRLSDAGSTGALVVNRPILGISNFSSRLVTVLNNGNTGFGVIVPTARVHVAGSTTLIAAMNLTVGVAPTAPNDGDIWLESNTITGLKIRLGGVTRTVTLT